nr:MAG TPA: hypothetical protein [Caudoviricetes sp.]
MFSKIFDFLFAYSRHQDILVLGNGDYIRIQL